MSRLLDDPRCRMCSIVLTESNRYPSHAKLGVRRCKACHRIRTNAWDSVPANREKLRAGSRHRHKLRPKIVDPAVKRDFYLRKNYGVTLDQFNALLSSQQNRCANLGCRTDTPKHAWHLDHDHKTGEIRGVLCSECNRLLGCAQDSIAILLGAVTYLSERRKHVETA